jgi:hypothetical protein
MKKATKRTKAAKTTKRSPSKRAVKGKKAKAARLEVEHFVKTLEANKQLSREPGPLPPGATHRLERDESGATHVVRKRYSAI